MDKRKPVTFLLLQDKVGDKPSLLESLSATFTNEVLVFNQDMSIIRFLSQEVKNVISGNQFLPFVIVLCPSLDAETSSEMVNTITKDDRDLVRKTPVFAMNHRNPPRHSMLRDSKGTDFHMRKAFDMDTFLEWLDKLTFLKMEKLDSGKRLLYVYP